MTQAGEERVLDGGSGWGDHRWDGRIRTELIGKHGAIWHHCGPGYRTRV